MYWRLYLDWRHWYQLARRMDNKIFGCLPRAYRQWYHTKHYENYRALLALDPQYVNVGTWDDPLNVANDTPVDLDAIFAHNFQRNTRLTKVSVPQEPSS